MISPIVVPSQLEFAPPSILEDYVKSRLVQFVQVFSELLKQELPSIPPGIIKQVANKASCLLLTVEASLTSAPPTAPPTYNAERSLQLVLRHKCMALGCSDQQCVLCQNDPDRPCSTSFDCKYLVNEILKAKCNATITVELVDIVTGVQVSQGLPDIQLQVCVVHGNEYKTKISDLGRQQESNIVSDDQPQTCALLFNNKGTPLLVCGGAGSSDSSMGFVNLRMNNGLATLNDMFVSDSSEAIMGGRKPPFRLLVQAIPMPGSSLTIKHVMSEAFVVTTRRAGPAGKLSIPRIHDPIRVLVHMGPETVSKLLDLRNAGLKAGLMIEIPLNSVQDVGQFKQLIRCAEQDGTLKQRLQTVLKLSSESWDEAKENAAKAVATDSRMRVWYPEPAKMDLGLLFGAHLGKVDLSKSVGHVEVARRREGADTLMKVVTQAEQSPVQLDTTRQLQLFAVEQWKLPGHPGWSISPVNSFDTQQTRSQTPNSFAAPFFSHPFINAPSNGMPRSPITDTPPAGMFPTNSQHATQKQMQQETQTSSQVAQYLPLQEWQPGQMIEPQANGTISNCTLSNTGFLANSSNTNMHNFSVGQLQTPTAYAHRAVSEDFTKLNRNRNASVFGVTESAETFQAQNLAGDARTDPVSLYLVPQVLDRHASSPFPALTGYSYPQQRQITHNKPTQEFTEVYNQPQVQPQKQLQDRSPPPLDTPQQNSFLAPQQMQSPAQHLPYQFQHLSPQLPSLQYHSAQQNLQMLTGGEATTADVGEGPVYLKVTFATPPRFRKLQASSSHAFNANNSTFSGYTQDLNSGMDIETTPPVQPYVSSANVFSVEGALPSSSPIGHSFIDAMASINVPANSDITSVMDTHMDRHSELQTPQKQNTFNPFIYDPSLPLANPTPSTLPSFFSQSSDSLGLVLSGGFSLGLPPYLETSQDIENLSINVSMTASMQLIAESGMSNGDATPMFENGEDEALDNFTALLHRATGDDIQSQLRLQPPQV